MKVDFDEKLFLMKVVLMNLYFTNFEFSANFADNCQDSRRLRHHCGTRVCSMTMPVRCATHVFRHRQNRQLFGQGLRVTGMSQCE